MTAAAGWNENVAREIVARLAGLEGATLPILHALQHEFGYVDAAAVDLIADALNISRAEVHGTISFYHDFRSVPAGRRVIKICRAEACQANGCEDLLDEVRARAGHAPDVAGDDRLTIETVYCLGNCALGPNALVDGELVGRLDADRLIDLCNAGSVAGAQVVAGEAK
jgi:formate dehydrogenase subunit gamma